MQACDYCHGKKVRCDKAHPCRRCRDAGRHCEYTDRSKGKVYSQSHVDLLERRITSLERRNRHLAQQVSSASSPSAASAATVTRNDEAVSPQRAPVSARRPSDVIGEVSYLSMNAAGERHYLGSSSGVLLANFIKANVEVQPPSRLPSPPRERGGLAVNALADSTPDLPSERVSLRLVLTYLNHDHLCYPVVQPASLIALVKSVYGTDPTFYARHPTEAFIFDIILAIATASIWSSDWHVLPTAQSHYCRAMTKIPKILESGGLASLRAVIVLIQFRMSSSIQDNSASMWHLVGVGARIALELGLHRESAYPMKQRPSHESDASEYEVFNQQELSRLCFWSIISMDRIVSNILGRPLAVRREDIDAALPSRDMDSILQPSMADSEPDEMLTEVLQHDRVSIFVHIVKYRLLCGKIMTLMHTKPNPGQTDSNVRASRESLSDELDAWRLETTSLDLSASSQDTAPATCFLSSVWFDMIYHNAMLMIYRPSPTLDISRDAHAVQMIFTSSKSSILAYAALHRSRTLNHSWLTLQAVFMSGLSLVYAVTMHFQERRRMQGGGLLDRDPSTIEVVNDTRACSNVLVAVSERWKSLQHCFDVFNRLSDAVLADVIKFESGQLPSDLVNTAYDNTQPTSSTIPPVQQHPHLQPDNVSWSTENLPLQDQVPTQPPSFNPSPLAVENQLRDSYEDLQQLYNQNYVDISVYQLSQAWFDSFDVTGTLDGTVHESTGASF